MKKKPVHYVQSQQTVKQVKSKLNDDDINYFCLKIVSALMFLPFGCMLIGSRDATGSMLDVLTPKRYNSAML